MMVVTVAFVNIIKFEAARCLGKGMRREEGEERHFLSPCPVPRACADSSRLTDEVKDKGNVNSTDDKD